MKKRLFLLLLVLGFSSTAWGYCHVNVTANQEICDGPITATATVCCCADCEFESVEYCRWGRVIYANVYLTCECVGGCEPLVLTEDDLEGAMGSELCCGPYILVVRVWCTYECWPYCMFGRPIFCGMGSTAFCVCSQECNCCPPCPGNCVTVAR